MDYSLPGSSVHGIFQEEYWSELPFPSPRDLPDPGIELMSFTLAGGFFTNSHQQSLWITDLTSNCPLKLFSHMFTYYACQNGTLGHCFNTILSILDSMKNEYDWGLTGKIIPVLEQKFHSILLTEWNLVF